MTDTKTNKNEMTGRVLYKDQYGYYVCKVDEPKYVARLKEIEASLKQKYKGIYLPVWTGDDYGTLKIDKLDSTGKLFRMKVGNSYSFSFKLKLRTKKSDPTIRGSKGDTLSDTIRYILVKLDKMPKLFKEEVPQGEEEELDI